MAMPALPNARMLFAGAIFGVHVNLTLSRAIKTWLKSVYVVWWPEFDIGHVADDAADGSTLLP
jgi:hypothetical protein